MSQTRLTVRIPQALYERLSLYGDRERINKNEVIISALRFYLDAQDGGAIFDSFGEQRMNQMVELMIGIQERLDGMTLENREFMDTMIRMTNGDNYLTD